MATAEPDYDALREEGRRAAATAMAGQAPDDPLARVAWADGWGQEDQVRAAVQAAREAGISWAALGRALGVHRATVETKYGKGYERQKAYRERRRRQGDER